MKWLLDTNVVSENVSRQANADVITWISEQLPEQIAMSAVTFAELRDGAALTANAQRKAELVNWIEKAVTLSFQERIVPVTIEVLMDWLALIGKLGAQGRPQAAADLLIASTARVHGLILVTRNISDFANTGITLYNPWTNETHKMEMP